MSIGAGLDMSVVVVQKFTFAISSPDEFLSNMAAVRILRFVISVFGPPAKGISWSLSLCKIGWN